MYLILFLIFILIAIFALAMGYFVNFHFRKLGVENDKNAQRIMKIYKIGGLVIFLLSAVSLILLRFIK